ncbi:hypothetical protein MKW94_026868 [Papaver nudicaule]|uniref:Uncharacterized protein n=1 Tax=Papaver nudicaule TaxID=74823 RepID=A0AA41RT16_PAPNU|nr:hypothetical protein [Papaver nudicaule]
MEPRIIAAAEAAKRSSKQVYQVNLNLNEEELINSRELAVVVEEQVIRWEKFLPRRFLRVLLVETDDSTRHIVTALLRKCNYQVAAVADGLKAWAILKRKPYNFDLVLTEVVMPSLSGIGLLSKIMKNDICKSIPVIMMSSHDSIGIVFKCMLKGASDFLVKPVRKNELRNLWQHVWRKYCQSGSSGDGSEDGIPNKTKNETDSDNEVASNRGSENAGIRSKADNSSDRGSRTQSSCRKSAMETESAQKLEKSLPEAENIICCEGTDPEIGNHDFIVAAVSASSTPEKAKGKDTTVEKEIKITLSIHDVVSTEKDWGKTAICNGSLHWGEAINSVRREKNEIPDPKYLDQNDGINKLPKEIIEFLGTALTTHCSDEAHETSNQREDILLSSAKSSDKKRTMYNSVSSDMLELSLRRPQLNKEEEVRQTKHVLNHSIASAFSRYRNVRNLFSCPRNGSSSASKTNEGDDHHHDILEKAGNGRRFLFSHIQTVLHGRETPMNCQFSSGCDKEIEEPSASVHSKETACLGISSNKDSSPHPQLEAIPFTTPVGVIPFHSMVAGLGTMMQPIFCPDRAKPHLGQDVIPDLSSHKNTQSVNNTLNWSSHQYLRNRHSNRLKRGAEAQRADIEPAYPRPRVLAHTNEKVDLGGNCNFAITIGNGGNGTSENISVPDNNGTAPETGNEDGFITSNGNGLDLNRSRREVALTKFRLKRKDRCFEKKVRYQNRKKLAEQRPRIKGQFVRQPVGDQPL